MPKARSGSLLLEGVLIFRGFPKLHLEAVVGLRGFCDLAETAFLEPSCNTDQGVKQTCEFAGVKPIGVMKVSIRCQGASWQHQPPLIFCEARE